MPPARTTTSSGTRTSSPPTRTAARTARPTSTARSTRTRTCRRSASAFWVAGTGGSEARSFILMRPKTESGRRLRGRQSAVGFAFVLLLAGCQAQHPAPLASPKTTTSSVHSAAVRPVSAPDPTLQLVDRRLLVVWTRGALPAALAGRVRGLRGIAAATPVVAGGGSMGRSSRPDRSAGGGGPPRGPLPVGVGGGEPPARPPGAWSPGSRNPPRLGGGAPP